MRIALGQINTTVGDLPGNADRMIRNQPGGGRARAAEVIVFPELSLTGYPPRDLVEKANFSLGPGRVKPVGCTKRTPWTRRLSVAMSAGRKAKPGKK